MEVYESVFIGLWLILSTIIIQAIVLIRSHRRHKGYKVGVIDPALGQESFLFRSYRAFWNSMENIVPMFGMALIAIFIGYDAETLNAIVWIYAISRIIHMFLYYFVATDKNPSIRSIFWGIGFFANLYLMIDLGIFLL
ncbi:MAG: MAPEG family protein [Pseudomonadota bacterium]|nr:MAPEG family protein [Pseudomonadota bacterium]